VNLHVVTIRLSPHPDHDPHRKLPGPCPLTDNRDTWCTDATGEHHSTLVRSDETTEELAERMRAEGHHVTRIETCEEQ
jgi:hypothetical protein